MARILLADGDFGVTSCMSAQLTFMGHEVDIAENGDVALQRVQATEYDLIISNIRMPVMTGLWFLDAVMPQIEHVTPLMLITGYHDASTAMAAMRAGAIKLLLKPWDVQDLKVAVKQGLARRAQMKFRRGCQANLERRIQGVEAELKTSTDQITKELSALLRGFEPTARDQEHHRAVYATPGLPAFQVYEVDARLYAGRNPLTAVDVAELVRRGITHVIDLREEYEWGGPDRFGAEAVEELDNRGVERRNLVVADLSPPTAAVLDAATAWMEEVLGTPGTKVFVHCRAGRERTGCVLAALLVARGMPLEDALGMLKARCGAAPLPAQVEAVRAWVAARPPTRSRTRRDRLRGCLLGGAIGDALGAPVEFDSLAEIRHKFGRAGVTGFAPAYGLTGAITDDTQMTLFTVEGLIRAQQRRDSKGVSDRASVVRLAYLRWLDTQGQAAGVKDANHALATDARGWLADEPTLRQRREPGGTCLSGLRSGRLGTPEDRLNDSKGCGGVMRVAPVGLMASDPFSLGCELAALTHGHPTGFIAAGAFAVAIDVVAKGGTMRDAVAAARRAAVGHPEGGEVVAAIDKAVAAADVGKASPEVLETLGGGWIAEESLAITFYCALVEPDVRRSLLLAVNHSGDSDSTGSMVGQLLGAAHGIQALPPEWVAAVEGREIIERLAEDFAVRFVDGRELEWEVYPGV